MDPPLRQRACRRCRRPFAVCASCDRGHAYCTPACRAAGRRRSVRAANARHQRSPEGRLDHRDRQRAYRARRARRRYAIPFFLGPHVDTLIECLPTCRAPGNEPRFAPITYGDYLEWWDTENYPPERQDDA